MHRSGFYKWLRLPVSQHMLRDRELTKHIRHFFQESGETYGSPRIHKDLQEAGIKCARKRVARLMRADKIKALRSFKRRRYCYTKPSEAAPNILEQDFSANAPNKRWVTDITQIQTYQGWLYLAIVEDLYSRMVVGWSMQSSMRQDLVLDALLMAVWKRDPQGNVIIHSDQGSQYGSDAWKRFCRDHNLVLSMSRRGNCYDNAVLESFNSTLKKERVRGKIYKTRNEARADIFEYIETFYNPRRRHSYLGNISPVQFEEKMKKVC